MAWVISGLEAGWNETAKFINQEVSIDTGSWGRRNIHGFSPEKIKCPKTEAIQRVFSWVLGHFCNISIL